MKITIAESPQEAHDRIVGTLTAWKTSMDGAAKSSREARKAIEEATEREIWKVSGHASRAEWVEKVCGITPQWYRALMRTVKMIDEIREGNYFLPDSARVNIGEIEDASANAQSELAKAKPGKRAQVWQEAKAEAGAGPVTPRNVRNARAKVDHRKAPEPAKEPVTVPEPPVETAPAQPEPPGAEPPAREDPAAVKVIARLTAERDALKDELAAAKHDWETQAEDFEVVRKEFEAKIKVLEASAKPGKTGALPTARDFLAELGQTAMAMVDRIPPLGQQKQDDFGNLVLSGVKAALELPVAKLVNRRAVA